MKNSVFRKYIFHLICNMLHKFGGEEQYFERIFWPRIQDEKFSRQKRWVTNHKAQYKINIFVYLISLLADHDARSLNTSC
jgi:hypothetical protein